MATNVSTHQEQGTAYPFQLGLIPPGQEADFRLPDEEQTAMVHAEADFDLVYGFLYKMGHDGFHLGNEVATLTSFGHYDYRNRQDVEAPQSPPLYVVRAILIQAHSHQRSSKGTLVPYIEADCVITPYDNVAYAETHVRPKALVDHESKPEPFGEANLERFARLHRVAAVITERSLRNNTV